MPKRKPVAFSVRIAAAALLAAAALWTALALRSAQSEPQFGTGLRLASPERLRGVPLAFTPYAGDTLPAAVDLSPDMPPPGQQGRQNSCVGWALAYALKSYEERIEEKRPYLLANGAVDAGRVFSPAFLYHQCNNGRNVPVLYMDAFNVLSETGAATWADMPYDADDLTSQPSTEARRRAARYKIDFWRQVNVQDLKEVKAHLHAGFPVAIGANVDQAFLKLPAGQVWSSIGTPIGGHAMLVVGYDDARQAFRLMNSWGPQWADGGFCWVGYDHFRAVVNEGYVAKDARNGPSAEIERPLPASLTITGVTHNATIPNQPEQGFFMRFDGTLEIPAGLGQADQVAVYFYYDTGGGLAGGPVASSDRRFADPNGWAAGGTQKYAIPAEGLRTTWIVWIPNAALAVPPGGWFPTPTGNEYRFRSTAVLAQSVLFIDNFGVARSPLIPFQVRK